MNAKYLITTSIFALISISSAQATDILIPEHPVPVIVAPVISWTGFYLGGQIGKFSNKIALSYLRENNIGRGNLIEKMNTPKLSGYIGGVYAGSNVDINNGFIIGVDTDIMWFGKSDRRKISCPEAKQRRRSLKEELEEAAKYRSFDESIKPGSLQHTLKEKWFGATRVRVGFSTDRIMPYAAGGITYTQLRSICEPIAKISKKVDSSDFLHNEKKMMVGYTLGGGVDFAMTNNIILRAEYRYSNFGKKRFAHDKIEIGYKINDFRVGVAYKF
ncbi:outer membrane protein [Bartonella sp. B17]